MPRKFCSLYDAGMRKDRAKRHSIPFPIVKTWRVDEGDGIKHQHLPSPAARKLERDEDI